MSTSVPESMREHCLELPEDPVTSLNLVAMAAEAWGGVWQAEDRRGGRLGIPVMAGIRQGWVAGRLTAEPYGEGSRLTYRVDKSHYRVRKLAALFLFVAALGALITVIGPFIPPLLRLLPFGFLLSLSAWFFIVARLRNSGPEEFFEELAAGTGR